MNCPSLSAEKEMDYVGAKSCEDQFETLGLAVTTRENNVKMTWVKQVDSDEKRKWCFEVQSPFLGLLFYCTYWIASVDKFIDEPSLHYEDGKVHVVYGLGLKQKAKNASQDDRPNENMVDVEDVQVEIEGAQQADKNGQEGAEEDGYGVQTTSVASQPTYEIVGMQGVVGMQVVSRQLATPVSHEHTVNLIDENVFFVATEENMVALPEVTADAGHLYKKG
ncbi:hypothetical protein VNO78_17295 [Psophocarpus tetragonolobus]|uniref:Uncharacterized protein n=1 Tax=Psophocarpus tetragonolobus TaxID=3891 RepID=A0AAN9XLA9_PSOTE